jgi:hypothetical protein
MTEGASSRAGRREANLRAVNARVVEALDTLDGGAGAPITIVCECARTQCDRMIEVPRAVFDRARLSPIQFVVAEGHVLMEIESAIESGHGFVVVEKHGAAARTAAEEWHGA